MRKRRRTAVSKIRFTMMVDNKDVTRRLFFFRPSKVESKAVLLRFKRGLCEGCRCPVPEVSTVGKSKRPFPYIWLST